MKRRRMIPFILGLVLVLALLGILAVVFQNKLIYFPSHYPGSLKPGEGEAARFVKYTANDGREQWGYLIEPRSRGGRQGDRRSAEVDDRNQGEPGWGETRPRFYIVFYGNASNALGEAPFYEELSRATGCGFFIVDYRGYGFNAGSPTERGLVADALGAYDTLEREGRFTAGVGVIGHSLGAAAGFALAVERRVDRLITLSAFTSIEAMARRYYPPPLYMLTRNHWPNDARLKELMNRAEGERPREIVLLHGRSDEIIPFEMGEKLAATPGEGLRFIPIEGAAHNDIHGYAFEEMVKLLSGAGR